MTLDGDLAYSFRDQGLLRLALTHRSVSADDPARNDNERLEFLGDAVLQLVITDLLFGNYPHLAEGQMAKVRAAVVSRPMLAEIARAISLGRYVELATGEDGTGGREKDSILADALEAVLGAIYLDSGLEEVRTVIHFHWEDRVAERAKSPGVKDYKTRLQEWLARDGRKPHYDIVGSGPDHDRRFEAVVSVDGQKLGAGCGQSKKSAEQAAAQVALDGLNSDRR